MYQVSHFAESRLAVNQRLIEDHPLGLLICHDADGRLSADPVPFLLDRSSGTLGTLEAHVARANPLWQTLADECLVVFSGPQAYVSPNWYPSKREHGKVVPTWNYISVQVRGVPEVIQDGAWLKRQLNALTKRQEQVQSTPWRVQDAPTDFVERMIRGIVGIRIPLNDIQGKWKVSQNRPAEDIAGVHDGLLAVGNLEMAKAVGEGAPAEE